MVDQVARSMILHFLHFPQNIESLQQAGVMALLRPLLLDNVPR